MENKINYNFNLVSICVILFVSVLNVYNKLSWTPYLVIMLLMCIIIYNGIQSKMRLNIRSTFTLLIVFFITVFNVISGELTIGIVSYLIPLGAVFAVKQILDIYGKKFYINLLQYLSVIINVLAIFNIYQIILKKPILYYFLNETIKTYQFVGMEYYRTSSIFGNAIPACQVFIVGFFLNILIKRKYSYLINFILLIDIYSTQSRSGWISLGVGVLMLIFLSDKKINVKEISFNLAQFITVSILTIATSIIALLNYKTLITTIVTRFGDSLNLQNSTDISNMQRILTIDGIIAKMFSGSRVTLLFGNGAGSSRDFMRENKMIISNFDTTDNQMLSIFYDLGLIIMIVLVIFLIFFIMKTIKNKEKNLLFSLIIFSSLTVGLFFYEGFNWPIISILWGLFLVGCSLNNCNQEEEGLK